jgi:putative ABC transport system permease protein
MKHRDIDVRPQHRLPAGQILRLCLRGVRHRLLRSVLTLAVVALAVAFFMFLLCENAVMASVGRGVRGELWALRAGVRLVSQLFTPLTPEALPPLLAHAAADERRLAELAAVSGFTPVRMHALAASCADELRFTAFLDGLSLGKRTVLVGKRRGREALQELAVAGGMDRFATALQPMPDVRVPGGLPALRVFAAGFANYTAEWGAFLQAWNDGVTRSVAAARQQAGDRELDEWLSSAEPEAVEGWRRAVAAIGFDVTPPMVAHARAQLAAALFRRRLVALLNAPEGRQAWKHIYHEKQSSSAESRLLRIEEPLAHVAVTSALARVAVGGLIPADVAPPRLAAAAAAERQDRQLTQLERRLAPTFAADSNRLSGRQTMLLLISFLVCMVGIANAMLMSITERFREIATMKCLGATDRYVLLQFMMEAGLQGAAGGVLGVAAGFLIASLKGLVELHGYLITYWPAVGLLVAAGASLLAGVFLAVLASVYPAWSASRMAPMEAMRVE